MVFDQIAPINYKYQRCCIQHMLENNEYKELQIMIS
jgi:hypothetical protein